MKRKLTDQDYCDASENLKCEPEALKAVDVCPEFSRNNVFHCLAAESVTLCQSKPFFTSGPQIANFHDLLGSQFRAPVLFTALIHQCQMVGRTFTRVTFVIPIKIIRKMSAEKKMVGVHAAAIVARVTNKKIAGIYVIANQEGNSVCAPVIASVPEAAVSIRANKCRPFMATRFVNDNLLSESLNVLLGYWDKVTIRMGHVIFSLTENCVVRLAGKVNSFLRAAFIILRNAHKQEVFN